MNRPAVIFVLFFLQLLNPLAGSAEVNAIDSLLHVIEKLKSTGKSGLALDSLLYKNYNELSVFLRIQNPDSSAKCVDFIIRDLESKYLGKNNYDNQLRFLLANAYHQKAKISYFQGDNEMALICYKAALRIRTELNDKKGSANILSNIGVLYKNQGDFPAAIANHLEALKIRELISDSDGIATSYNNIGSVYFVQNSFGEALKNFERALAIRQAKNDRNGMAGTLNNIGNIFLKEEKFTQSLEKYTLALKMALEIADKKLMAECYNNIGNNYFLQFKNEEARQNFKSAIALQEEIGDNRGMSTTYKNLGWTYSANQQYDEVLKYLDKAMEIALKVEARDLEMMLYQNYAEIYSRMKRFDLAYANQIRYDGLKDTILSAEKNQQIAELQTRYETEKKDKEISLLNKDKALKTEQLKSEKTFRNAILFGSIMAFLLVILAVNRYRVLTEERKKTERAEFEKELHELQMKALRSQMNPHFIFNCLNSIQRYILKNDKNNAVEYLQKFASLMRLILDNSEKNMVPLADEIKMLELYIHLEALRLDQGMDIEMNIANDIHQEDIMLPSMLLQPFVENAILHGLMHKEEKGKLKIEISRHNNLLKCVVEDNGIGRARAAEIKSKKAIRHESKGLNITKARVDLLNQMNNSTNTIIVHDLKDENECPSGTRVEITIPVN